MGPVAPVVCSSDRRRNAHAHRPTDSATDADRRRARHAGALRWRRTRTRSPAHVRRPGCLASCNGTRSAVTTLSRPTVRSSSFVDDITEGRHNNGADLVMSALSAWRTAELPFGLEPVV